VHSESQQPGHEPFAHEPFAHEPFAHEPFGGAGTGTPLGPITFAVSRAASDRYWEGAGIDHPARAAGLLYPPMAANLTILAFQTVAPRPLLHTAQRLECHRASTADVELTVTGTVAERYEKRGREYAVVRAVVALPDGDPLWTSTATFTEVTR
jgi:hypothetical protein